MTLEFLSSVVAELESGSRPKGGVSKDSGTIPSLGGEHLNKDGGFKFDKLKYIDETFFNTMKKGSIKENDILIVKDGATTGKVSFVDQDFPFKKAAINEHLFSLRVDRSKASPRYVFLYLKSPQGQKQILKDFRGAAIGGISRGFVDRAKIPLPPLDDQIRIAHLLRKVEGLIAQRKQNLQQLDDLLKSVFLEMFGPTNSEFEEWPLVKIRDLAAKHRGAMRTGPFGSNLLHSEFAPDGDVAVLGIDNAVQNFFAWGEPRFITNEKYEELKNYRIFPGDVIITIMGTIGRSAVVPEDIPLAINTKHLAAITLNQELANPLFLSYSIHSSPYIINQFKSKNRGAIMSGLNLTIIRDTKLRIPPIEQQKEFAMFHVKVNEIKTQYLKSLTELENLYGSLSQKAFKGELDLSRIPVTATSVIEKKVTASIEMDEAAIEEATKEIEKILSNPMDRENFLRIFFEQYIDENRGQVLDLEDFWRRSEVFESAQYDETVFIGSTDYPWGQKDYDSVKRWIFTMLEEGKLAQEFAKDEGQKSDNKIQVLIRE